MVCDMQTRIFARTSVTRAHALEKLVGIEDFCDNKELGPDSKPERPMTWSHAPKRAHKPTVYMDVFMDDFCRLGQDSCMNPLLNQQNMLVHDINKVFWPNDKNDNEFQMDPILIMKLQKGDASFQGKKK
jgi:hypothetical protein